MAWAGVLYPAGCAPSADQPGTEVAETPKSAPAEQVAHTEVSRNAYFGDSHVHTRWSAGFANMLFDAGSPKSQWVYLQTW